MMPELLTILFVLNPVSGGKKKPEWKTLIMDYFKELPHKIDFYELTGGNDQPAIQSKIKEMNAQRVVAVGGDGTVSLVGKILIQNKILLGILPGGSANGMAAELKIPSDPQKALDIIVSGKIHPCDTIRINEDDMVFHLADLGLNAQIIKYFDESRFRGMLTYSRMLFKALANKSLMKVHLKGDNLDETIAAYMIVIANASKYGTGAVINPDAVTDDGVFELVIVRRIALSEFIKLFWSYKSFNPRSVEIIETKKVEIISKKSVRFQIDGEYKGKIKNIRAEIMPASLRVLVPEDSV
ncbi:MAG: diacylglycerol kinase family protein [Ginsengibacter sp.]|jgi:YegS/Rv2252/BmrU family lipid kinase